MSATTIDWNNEPRVHVRCSRCADRLGDRSPLLAILVPQWESAPRFRPEGDDWRRGMLWEPLVLQRNGATAFERARHGALSERVARGGYGTDGAVIGDKRLAWLEVPGRAAHLRCRGCGLKTSLKKARCTTLGREADARGRGVVFVP